jgi:hypothetical protein
MDCITVNWSAGVHENGNTYQDFTLSINLNIDNNQSIMHRKAAGGGEIANAWYNNVRRDAMYCVSTC